MKQIDSPRDLENMLQADRAVVFIYFPWSRHAARSLRTVAEWQRQPGAVNYPIFELAPDRHSFSWLWLDTIFGERPEQERTSGTVVWLQRGAVVAMLADASVAGAKTLARVTNDCFVLGKTHSTESIWSVQNEPAAFDIDLLKILCCPETRQALAFADVAVLDKLNQRFVSGQLRNRAGQPLPEKIEDGLVRADGRYLYPMRRNIPVLLIDEAIPL